MSGRNNRKYGRYGMSDGTDFILIAILSLIILPIMGLYRLATGIAEKNNKRIAQGSIMLTIFTVLLIILLVQKCM